MADLKLIKELRARTGAGITDCKKALEEASGDIEKAIEILRKKGIAKAAKKADRETKEGRVSYAENDNAVSMVLLTCETDFVARNEEFVNFTKKLAEIALDKGVKTLEELENAEWDGTTVSQKLQEFIGKIGENMKLAGYVYYEKEGITAIYDHMNGKMVVALSIKAEPGEKVEELKQFAKELAVQVAANEPKYLKFSEIPAELIEKEKEIAAAADDLKNKPDHVKDKIIEGRVRKTLGQICFLEQEHGWENMKIAQYIDKKGKELGEKMEVIKFSYLKV